MIKFSFTINIKADENFYSKVLNFMTLNEILKLYIILKKSRDLRRKFYTCYKFVHFLCSHTHTQNTPYNVWFRLV